MHWTFASGSAHTRVRVWWVLADLPPRSKSSGTFLKESVGLVAGSSALRLFLDGDDPFAHLTGSVWLLSNVQSNAFD